MTDSGQKLKDGKNSPNLHSDTEQRTQRKERFLLQRLSIFLLVHWRGFVLILFPLIFLPILFVETTEVKAFRCLYILMVMSSYWITEPIPLPVTSMLPVILFPAAGIMSTNSACVFFFKETVVMFISGIMMALAVENSNLHKRLALKVIRKAGCSPRRLHFDFILVTMFISLWMSNSATTALMCPIIKAVLEQLEVQGICKLTRSDIKLERNEPPYPSKITICFYMGTAYASTLGGCGTLIGTPTNLTLKGIYDNKFPNAKDQITFEGFLMYSAPPMIIYTLLVCLYMQIVYLGAFRPNSKEAKAINYSKDAIANVEKVIDEIYNDLGPISCQEISVFILYVILFVLYLTKNPNVFTGWDSLFELQIKYSSPTILILIMIFILPINYVFLTWFFCGSEVPDKPSNALLTWKFLQENVPWGLIFLLGGGFAVANGVEKSNLAYLLGNSLKNLNVLHPLGVLFLVIVFAEFVTELCSNVVVCNIIIPVLIEMSLSLKLHPLYFILPVGLACSMAFHTPVGTPSNAIVASFANIRTNDMIICGIGPSLITIIVIFVLCPTWGSVIYPNLHYGLPEWIIKN